MATRYAVDVHAVPEDVIGHETTTECVCLPEVEIVPARDGQVGVIAHHHRLMPPIPTPRDSRP